MERIRVGNDIAITWSLFESNGAAHLITPQNVNLSLCCGSYEYQVPEFNVENNIISFIFPSYAQTKTGKYKILLKEINPNTCVSYSIDVRDAFILVGQNEMLNIGYQVDDANISIRSILTSSNILNIKSMDIVQSLEDGGFNTVTFNLTTGESFEMVVKNGSKGEKGETGATGATGPQGIKGETGDQGPSGISTAEASIPADDTPGTPSVTASYDSETRVVSFAFRNLKGEMGKPGRPKFFSDSQALEDSGIIPEVGDYCFVSKAGDGTFPAYIYICTEAGTWTNSEEEYDGDDVDLTDYATKDEVSQLGQKIDKRTRDISQLFTISGTINGSSGADYSSEYYKRTEYIQIPSVNNGIKLVSSMGSVSLATLFFYDKDLQPISGVAFSTTETLYEIAKNNIPQDAVYFRLSCANDKVASAQLCFVSNTTELNFFVASDEDLKKTNERVDELVIGLNKTSNSDTLETLSTNGYWGLNGTYYASELARTTKPLKVDVGQGIRVKAVGLGSTITEVTSTGEYLRTLVSSEGYSLKEYHYSFDSVGYVSISYRAAEGLDYTLTTIKSVYDVCNYLGFGWHEINPNVKTPNGYWGNNGQYYNSESYRTSVPIKVNKGERIRVVARGSVSMVTMVMADGSYMTTLLDGTNTKEEHFVDVDFYGFVAISWRYEEGLYLSIQRSLMLVDNSSNILASVSWGAMGDSLTDPATLSQQADKRNYVDLITEQTGIQSINYGVSGSGYKRLEDSSKAFYQKALTVSPLLDVITIFGSGNDQEYSSVADVGNATDAGTNTLCGCMNTTIDNLLSVNPLFRIGIITPTPWKNYPPNSESSTWMRRYSEKIQEVCALRGLPCLDLYHLSNLRPWDDDLLSALYIDNTHPNTEGHKRIASQVKAFLHAIAG